MTVAVWREPVQDAWIDYNGHLSEPYYVLVLGHATDAVMDALGLGPAYQAANDASLYTVEAHVRYLREISPGSDLGVHVRSGTSASFPDDVLARAQDVSVAPPEHASRRINLVDKHRGG
jgi:acyl-CoA thioester hydrolase